MTTFPVEALARRQYVISTDPTPAWDGAVVVPIANNQFLHRCPTLPHQTLYTKNGETWHLLGIAVSTTREEMEPPANWEHPNALLAATRDWAGRWLLIGPQCIIPDAAALLRCFYINGSSPTWASSSVSLLKALASHTMGTELPRVFHHGASLEWYPLPNTRFAYTSQLLPTQLLDINSRVPYFRNPYDTICRFPSELAVSEMRDRLSMCFRNLAARFTTLHIPLTAGLDSRLLLACAINKPISDVRCFTQQHSKLNQTDRSISTALAKIAGVSYQFVQPKPSEPNLAMQYDAFSDCTYSTIVRDTYIHRQYDFLNDGIILRGNCFEVGRMYYGELFSSGSESDILQTLARRFHLNPESDVFSAMAAWVSWTRESPINNLRLEDRLYIEQRLGGWYAAIEHAFDLIGIEHLPPSNCVGLYNAMLSVDPELRSKGLHQKRLIHDFRPDLLKLPINPVPPRFRVRQLLKRLYKGAATRVGIRPQKPFRGTVS